MPSSKLEQLRAKSDQLAEEDPLLRWGTRYVDLEECSEKYQEAYKNAWKVGLELYYLLFTTVDPHLSEQ